MSKILFVTDRCQYTDVSGKAAHIEKSVFLQALNIFLVVFLDSKGIHAFYNEIFFVSQCDQYEYWTYMSQDVIESPADLKFKTL